MRGLVALSTALFALACLRETSTFGSKVEVLDLADKLRWKHVTLVGGLTVARKAVFFGKSTAVQWKWMPWPADCASFSAALRNENEFVVMIEDHSVTAGAFVSRVSCVAAHLQPYHLLVLSEALLKKIQLFQDLYAHVGIYSYDVESKTMLRTISFNGQEKLVTNILGLKGDYFDTESFDLEGKEINTNSVI